MKNILLVSIAIAFSTGAFAQKKIEVVATVSQREINYGEMDKVLPDSLSHIFLKLKRKSGSSDLAIVNNLCMNGWKIVTYNDVYNRDRSYPSYILKYEIFLNDEDYKQIQKKTQERMDHLL
jgi:hypothetical protein